MDPDPRLEGPAQAFARLTSVADQCLEEGKKRWSAALDRQASILDALSARGVTVAQGPTPGTTTKAADDGQ